MPKKRIKPPKVMAPTMKSMNRRAKMHNWRRCGAVSGTFPTTAETVEPSPCPTF